MTESLTKPSAPPQMISHSSLMPSVVVSVLLVLPRSLYIYIYISLSLSLSRTPRPSQLETSLAEKVHTAFLQKLRFYDGPQNLLIWSQELPHRLLQNAYRQAINIYSNYFRGSYQKILWEPQGLLPGEPLDQLQNRKAHEMKKVPPTYKMWDSPKYPFKHPPEYCQNTKIGYFRGIFFDLLA